MITSFEIGDVVYLPKNGTRQKYTVVKLYPDVEGIFTLDRIGYIDCLFNKRTDKTRLFIMDGFKLVPWLVEREIIFEKINNSFKYKTLF